MARRKGKSRKKTGKASNTDEELKACPHSFVFNRGKVGKNVADLITEMRRVMEPFTASHLRARRKNVLKDFVSVAGPLNVSHFLMFTKTDASLNLKVLRLPRGPTLTFKVCEYCLARDVVNSQRRVNMDPKQFQHHPLLVMNNFSGEGMHLRLMATMFQNLFPSINVHKVKLKDIRRCVLLNYDSEKKTIEFRHYNIRAVPVGMSRSVKKLIKARVPNLAKYGDVSEFVTRGDVSESEGELDEPHNEVILPQTLPGRGNIKANKSALRLSEIGPRLTLQLVKIEEGIAEGNVLFHEYISKTEEEVKDAARRRDKTKQLKAQRKKQQEVNIKRKSEQKEVNKERSLAGMKRKTDDSKTENAGGSDVDSDTREDIEYYTQEVGQAPEPELFPKNRRKTFKKRKFSDEKKFDAPGQPPEKKSKFSGKKENKAELSKVKSKFSKKSVNKSEASTKSKSKFQKKDGDKQKFSKTGGASKHKNKKFLTDLDKMKRSKERKDKRTEARKSGKRANRPRRC